MTRPTYFSDVEQCVDAIIDTVGKEIVIGLPLGLGKANHIANTLYRRARADADINLRIMTGLTLETPKGRSDLEKRFLGPLTERLFAGYVELDYAIDRRLGRLPDNVQVAEFFMAPGSLLGNDHAQQNYISSNYTHAARDLLDSGINVIGQLIAQREIDGERKFSLSCNPDLTLDLERHMREQQRRGKKVAVVGQVNAQLPFMYGDAVVPADSFDMVLESPEYEFDLFGPPKTPVSNADYMIGLYASTLIQDGGTLQVGIGSLGDAVVYAMQLRHERNSDYLRLLEDTNALVDFGGPIRRFGNTGVFDQGLYMATEMLVDGFMHLFNSGILKRKVYPDVHIQRLLNEGAISERVSLQTLDALVEAGTISWLLSANDVDYLQRVGIFRAGVEFAGGKLVLDNGASIEADLVDEECRAVIELSCLGEALTGGQVAHGGFFVGPQDFYAFLRDLSEEQRALIAMTSVLSVNQLYGNEVLDGLQRVNARFVNSCLMVTLAGAVVSDGLEDGEVISGVGGQFNFVDMAHALPDGRSIIKVRSTRESGGKTVSNIVWNHGHITIPRHLRDLVVSEYGIAELRGKTDKEIIMALLNITDSRFQPGLLARAKGARKIPANYEIPARFCNNYPERIAARLASYKADGLFAPFPYGTDLTDEEIVLGKALRRLKGEVSTPWGKVRSMLGAIKVRNVPAELSSCIARMGFDRPLSMKEKLLRNLVVKALENR